MTSLAPWQREMLQRSRAQRWRVFIQNKPFVSAPEFIYTSISAVFRVHSPSRPETRTTLIVTPGELLGDDCPGEGCRKCCYSERFFHSWFPSANSSLTPGQKLPIGGLPSFRGVVGGDCPKVLPGGVIVWGRFSDGNQMLAVCRCSEKGDAVEKVLEYR